MEKRAAAAPRGETMALKADGAADVDEGEEARG